MHSIPRRYDADKADGQIRQLISEMSKLTLQLTELSSLFEDATQQFLAKKSTPELKEIASRLMDAKMYVLDQLILEESLRLYEKGKCSKSQYQLTTQLIENLGSIQFVRKVLWSENVEDIGLSISLNEILSTLEKIVEGYPDLFLNQANMMISKIKYRD